MGLVINYNNFPASGDHTFITIKGNGYYRLYPRTSGWDGTMFFSRDKKTWYNLANQNYVDVSGAPYEIYIRGLGNTYCSHRKTAFDNNFDPDQQVDPPNAGGLFGIDYLQNPTDEELLTDKGMILSGNLLALLDYKKYCENQVENLQLSDFCFAGLFADSKCIVNAENLKIPIDVIPRGGLSYLFYKCSNLRLQPKDLSLINQVKDSGCFSAFGRCPNLENTPKFSPSIISANGCKFMYLNCTSLTKAPELPATTLGQNCYQSMFQGCTSLTEAPVLPALTLTDGCYQSMFQGCTSLIKPAPWGILASPEELVEDCLGPGGLVPNNCSSSAIANMYSGCINLSISTTRDANHPYWFVLPGFSDSTASVWVAQGISATGSDYKVYWISEPCLKPPVKPYTDKYRISQEHLKANGVYYGLTALGFDPSITLIEISPFYINGNDDGWSNLSIRPVSSRENFDFTIQNPDAIYGVTYALIKIQEVQPVSTYSGAPI